MLRSALAGVGVGLCLGMVLPAAARAQETAASPATPLKPADSWVVDASPRMWYVALDGDLTLPGVAGEVALDTLSLDHTTIQPMGQLDVRADRWLFTFGGGAVGNESSGGGVRSEIDLRLFSLMGGYQLVDYAFDAARDNVLRLWLLGGARLGDLDARTTFPGSLTEGDVQWVDLIGGARLEIQIEEQFFTTFEINAGGLSDSFSVDLMAGFTWRPVSWFGAQAGYRYVYLDVEDGEGSGRFGYAGSAAGLFAGVSFRF